MHNYIIFFLTPRFNKCNYKQQINLSTVTFKMAVIMASDCSVEDQTNSCASFVRYVTVRGHVIRVITAVSVVSASCGRKALSDAGPSIHKAIIVL